MLASGTTLTELKILNNSKVQQGFNFNFNFGGYMFFSNLGWTGANVITMPTGTNLNWSTTNTFAMIASDASGNVLSTLPTTVPTFTLFVFGANGAYVVALTIDSTYLFTQSNAKSSGGNAVAIGGLQGGSPSYPFAYIIN
jgi:hypothetical protein